MTFLQKWKFNESDDIIKENILAIETKQIKCPGINKYEVGQVSNFTKWKEDGP